LFDTLNTSFDPGRILSIRSFVFVDETVGVSSCVTGVSTGGDGAGVGVPNALRRELIKLLKPYDISFEKKLKSTINPISRKKKIDKLIYNPVAGAYGTFDAAAAAAALEPNEFTVFATDEPIVFIEFPIVEPKDFIEPDTFLAPRGMSEFIISNFDV